MHAAGPALYAGPVDLFDGTGSTLRRKHGVLVEGGRIAWVGAHARAPRAARSAETVADAGQTMLPGLFDCHVHLTFDGRADFLAEARETDPYAAAKAVRNAARHLEAGVTTVRDLGGPGTVACDVARAIRDGVVPGPRVIASGRALTITGGHGHGTLAMEVDGPEGMRLAVRQQARAGARSIKVIATGGVLTPGITADFTALTESEMDAAVEEAHSWGFPVAAHAIGEEGIRNAARAGVDSVEHGSFISSDTARRLKERGVYHVPTISAIAGIVGNPARVAPYALEKARVVGEAARDSFRRAVRAGVRHAVGTDAGTPFNPHGGAPLEIERMVEWGLPVARALLAATANAAALCRVAEETGTVQPGKAADLVAYEGNPLDDVTALRRPSAVVAAGAVVAGSRAAG